VPQFQLLDAYQLVKHFLGLSLTYPERPLTLVYLYWEPANPGEAELLARHRAEIDRFATLIENDDRCGFMALSYPEHWAELESGTAKPEWLDDHLAGLRRRYEVEI
jgi:Restriction Endonuclease associating with ARP